MSRSGYSDDCEDQWAFIRWRGVVASAIRGKRGQALLRAMADALDAMPVKELVAHELECRDGVCALGAVGRARGMDLSPLDPEDPDAVAAAFGIATPLAQEIVWINDEGSHRRELPSERWARVRAWVAKQIKPEPQP